jgi:hypothetical protein
MRRIVFTVALLIVALMGVSAFAQPARPPQPPDPLPMMLGLTADQKAAWDAAHADFEKQVQPLHDQLRAAHDALDLKLEAMLTPEQKAKFAAARAMRPPHHEPPPPPCPMP